MFDVGAGRAAKTLKQFAKQARLGIVFDPRSLEDVHTNEVAGLLIPSDALMRMLDNTSLVFDQDDETGAFAVTRSDLTEEGKLPTSGEGGVLSTEVENFLSGRSGNNEPDNTKPMKEKKQNISSLFKGLLAIAIAAAPDSSAQNDFSNAGDLFELTPFEVNAQDDLGYVATNTLAGSRLNTALKDTPASISVMTKEFLSDIGAADVNDAVKYGLSSGNDIGGGGANVGASTGNGLVGNEFNFQIRGFRNATATRDYFPTLLASDMFNVERMEVSRGPNSLIFGVGGPGGIINTSVKVANANQASTDFGLRIGSWGEQRGTIDVNRPIVEGKLGVRFNGLYQEADGWKDFMANDQERGALAFVFRPGENTKIRLNTEFGSMLQNRVRPWAAVDQAYSWEGQGSFYIPFGTPESPWVEGDSNYAQTRIASGGSPANGLTRDVPAGQTFERRTAHLGNPYVMLMDGPLEGKMLYVGNRNEGKRYYRTTFGNNLPGYNTAVFLDDESKYPRTANLVGSGAKHFSDYSNYNFTIDHRFGQNFNVNLTAATTTIDREDRNVMGFGSIGYKLDVTSTLPTFNTDGSYNATVGGPDTTGQGTGALNFDQVITNPYAGSIIASSSPSYSLTEQTQDDIRLGASYHLDLDSIGDHMLLGFAQSSKTGRNRQNFAETNISPNRPNTNTWFNSSNYAGRDAHVDVFASDLRMRGFPDPWENELPSGIYYGVDPASGYEFQPGWIRNNWNASETTIDSYAFALQSRFLNNSLVTTAGVRRDEVEIINQSRVRDSLGEATGLAEPGLPQTEKGDTYSIGAVYHFPRIEWLSLFANKSTNFQPQGGAQYVEDEILRPNLEIGALKGTGYDYGIKLRLLDDKAFVTLSAFDVSQANASTGFDGNFTSYVNAIWTTILNNGPITDMTDAEDPNGHRFGGRETRDQTAKGWELEFTANPTDSWRITLNVSKTDNAIAGLGNNLAAYFEKHSAEWNAARGLSYDTGRSPGFLGNNTVGDLVDGLDNLLALTRADEGLTETNIRPYNANLFTAYSFREGGLKGFTFGGGVNYRGEQILGVNPATIDNPVAQVFKGNDYFLTNAMFGYQFAMNDSVDVRLQLNVDNLLQNDDKQVLASRYNVVTSSLEPFYYYLEPRSYTFSANFSF